MSEALAYLHGRLVPQSQAGLALHDAGFVMGATVTDLCRTFQHRLYRWPDHLARFLASIRLAQIDCPLDDGAIAARADELVTHNAALLPGAHDLALVMFATPGPIGYYLGATGGAGDGPATFGMHTFPLPLARYRPWIEHGASLIVSDVRQIPPGCIDPHIKMRSRLHWWLADREARRRQPGAIAVLLDEAGNLTETAAANLLLVRDGTVLSPRRESILDGISRRVVIEMCAQLEVPYDERNLSVTDLLSADEAWLTSTPYCLVGVSQVNGKRIPWPGAVYQRLVKAWSTLVGLEIHGQIMA
jgi:branched-chain amino acid aminotransferase